MGELAQIWRTNDQGHEVLAAEGYEVERTCCAPDGAVEWRERVFVVRSPMHANHQAAGLETRLRHAETQLTARHPPEGGKRQITDEATLVEAINRVLTAHRVEELLRVVWEKQVEQTTQYVGRGRGSVEPREARHRANPLPHYPHRSSGRHPRRSSATFWLEGLCHQCGAHAAIFAGGGIVLPQRIPRGTHLQPSQEPGPHCTTLCQTQRANRGAHVPADARCPGVNGTEFVLLDGLWRQRRRRVCPAYTQRTRR